MSETAFYDFQVVLQAVTGRIEELITTLFPEAKKEAGAYRIGSLAGNRGRSVCISTRSNNAGCYNDHADPSVKGNAIGLVAEAKGMSYQEAGKWLAEFLGVRPEENLHVTKRRPTPKIDRAGIRALTQRTIDYAASRGITKETLELFKCRSTDTQIVMPHFNQEGETVMLKYWSCDGQKNIKSNIDPIPVLYGKHLIDPIYTAGELIITEGHWDAMTWVQLGYPAVSIPNGVDSWDWIAEDYTFLNCFSTIYLDFDDDPKGREAEQKARQRLGWERCKRISYRFKDANDALQAGAEDVLHKAFSESQTAPIERLVRAEDLKKKVRDRLTSTRRSTGTPFFLPSLSFEFRPHEVTLWYGMTSHGKSTLLSNQIAYAASLGKMCMVASFEQNTTMTLAGMLIQYTSDPEIGSSSEFDEAYDELSSRVLFYDSMVRVKPDELVATMTLAHKQLGVEEFVIDNVMTLEVDRQDNTAQADTADQIRVFASKYPVHVHVVAHPRKPGDENANKPPSISMIRGASEWGDMPNNVICVHRDTLKAERLSEMRDENRPIDEIQALDESMPDGRIIVRKQRDNGDLPLTTFRFDRMTKRAWKKIEDAAPYWNSKSLPGIDS